MFLAIWVCVYECYLTLVHIASTVNLILDIFIIIQLLIYVIIIITIIFVSKFRKLTVLFSTIYLFIILGIFLQFWPLCQCFFILCQDVIFGTFFISTVFDYYLAKIILKKKRSKISNIFFQI